MTEDKTKNNNKVLYGVMGVALILASGAGYVMNLPDPMEEAILIEEANREAARITAELKAEEDRINEEIRIAQQKINNTKLLQNLDVAYAQSDLGRLKVFARVHVEDVIAEGGNDFGFETDETKEEERRKLQHTDSRKFSSLQSFFGVEDFMKKGAK